jgi:hypothetical protein
VDLALEHSHTCAWPPLQTKSLTELEAVYCRIFCESASSCYPVHISSLRPTSDHPSCASCSFPHRRTRSPKVTLPLAAHTWRPSHRLGIFFSGVSLDRCLESPAAAAAVFQSQPDRTLYAYVSAAKLPRQPAAFISRPPPLERPRGVSSREGLALPISLCGCSSIPVRGESRIATLHHPTFSPSRRVLFCSRFFSPFRAA